MSGERSEVKEHTSLTGMPENEQAEIIYYWSRHGQNNLLGFRVLFYLMLRNSGEPALPLKLPLL